MKQTFNSHSIRRPNGPTEILKFTIMAAALTVYATVASAQLVEQSPVNITKSATSYNPSLPELNFSYKTTSLDVVNTGSPGVEATIKANVPSGSSSVTVSGDQYNLLEFHFHTAAEHLVEGVQSPMELHMVNQDASGRLLVVGRFIEVGAANADLAPIFSNLPTSPSTPLEGTSINLANLLPATLTSFRYPGSLTTSPYAEDVQWVVLSQPLTMSQAQIDEFRALFPQGDSRPVQPLNARSIQTDVIGFASAPEPASMSFIAAVSLGLFAARRHFSS